MPRTKLSTLLLLCFFSGWSQADSLLLPAFPFSTVVESETRRVEYHQLLLSTPKKINNEFRFERDRHVAGSLQVQLLKVDDGHSSEEVFEYYLLQFKEANGTIEYQCEARGCGVSNHWANSIFEEPRLYGRDNDQYYYIGQRDSLSSKVWQYVYVSKRVNKNVHVLVGQVRENPRINAEDWSQGVHFTAYLDLDSSRSLKAYLALHPNAEIAVLAYNNETTELAESIALSAQSAKGYAEKIAEAFPDHTVSHVGLGRLALLPVFETSDKGFVVQVITK